MPAKPKAKPAPAARKKIVPRLGSQEADTTQGTLPTQSAASLGEDMVDGLCNTATVHDLVDSALSAYATDPYGVLAVILNTVSKACGVTDTVLDGKHVSDTTNIALTLEGLHSRVALDGDAYFIINKDAKYRRFRKAFPEFFEQFISKAAANNLLADGVLVEVLFSWLAAMSESKALSVALSMIKSEPAEG